MNSKADFKSSKKSVKKSIIIVIIVAIYGMLISCDSKSPSKSENGGPNMNITSVDQENVKTGDITTSQPPQVTSILITSEVKSLSIKPITGDGNNIIITINNKNIYDGTYNTGYLTYGKQNRHSTKSKDYRTTKWFSVIPQQGKSLVLSGTAHNRATWQFKTKDEKIITEVGTPLNYKVETDIIQNRTFSKVDIPSDAVSARVYFANYKEEGSDLLDDRLQIEYGKVPTNYQTSQHITVVLPTVIKENKILFEDGKWKIINQNNSEDLNLPPLNLQVGDTLSITTDTECDVQVTWKEKQNYTNTGTYGVRWKLNDSNPVAERVGDAAGLHFNAVEGDTSLTPYENNFDYIYPWSDIKVCAVKVKSDGQREVTYKGDDGFALDGSSGNIMVEIPKFYCKREIIDDYEYLWISPMKQEGFNVDPSFLTSEGELDHIYIGAYLSSIEDDKLTSTSQSFPFIKRSLEQLRKLVPHGFAECDLLTIMTVQRLFLVETAVLDSQSIFTGNVNMPYLIKDKSSSYYAVKSEKHTNQINLRKTKVTQRLHVGDAFSILSSWSEYENNKNYQREIIDIKDEGNGTLVVTFTGEPIDIIKQETGITCLPSITGETDHILSSSGSASSYDGQSSFQYRGIENLWGDVAVLLDGAYVKNSELFISFPDKKTVKIDCILPVQDVQLSVKQFGAPSSMIIKRMCYDQSNPLIMFPSEIGNGALTSSYYCDAWYNLAKEDVTYILTYGGAWDNRGYAGIFTMRATFTDQDVIPFNGSRIMLR